MSVEMTKMKEQMEVHLTYSFVWLMLLYGGITGILLGLYAVNLFGNVPGEYVHSFTSHMASLPIAFTFYMTMLLSQVVIGIGFLREERKGKEMQGIQVATGDVMKSRFLYSVLVALSSMMVHFLTLCVMYGLYAIRFSEYVYGSSYLYTMFYNFRYLTWFYPITEPLRFAAVLVALLGISMISLRLCMMRRGGAVPNLIAIGALLVAVPFTVCGVRWLVRIGVVVVILMFVVLYYKHMRRKGENYAGNKK